MVPALEAGGPQLGVGGAGGRLWAAAREKLQGSGGLSSPRGGRRALMAGPCHLPPSLNYALKTKIEIIEIPVTSLVILHEILHGCHNRSSQDRGLHPDLMQGDQGPQNSPPPCSGTRVLSPMSFKFPADTDATLWATSLAPAAGPGHCARKQDPA